MFSCHHFIDITLKYRFSVNWRKTCHTFHQAQAAAHLKSIISLSTFSQLLITEGGSCYSPCKAIRLHWDCQKQQLRGKDSLQRLSHLIFLISIALFSNGFKLGASMFSYSLLQASAAADNLKTTDKSKSARKRSSSQVIILTETQNQGSTTINNTEDLLSAI